MNNWSGIEVAAVITALGVLITGVLTNIAALVIAFKTGKKVDGILEQRDAANVAAGERKGQLAGEQVAATLAEGQRQGREQAREERPESLHATSGPVPVVDDKAAGIAERSMLATEKIAAAATEK